MDVIPLSKWFFAIFMYGFMAFFLNAIEVGFLHDLGLASPWLSWIVILVTDVSAGVVFFTASARLIMVAQKRG